MNGKKWIEEHLQDWSSWEQENGLHSPDNIKEGETTSKEELRYAAGRTWTEIREGLEVAEAVDRAEKGEEIEFEDFFDYTVENEKYDQNSVRDHTQLKDELGYELADIALFAVKITTSIETGFQNTGYTPEYSVIADKISRQYERNSDSHTATLENVYDKLDPASKSSTLYLEVMSENPDEQKILDEIDDTISSLSLMASNLPRNNLATYISEKINYNKARSIENMDADHPEPTSAFQKQ